MALSTARIHRVRGRPPLLAAGIKSLIHSHSSLVRSLGYIFSFIYLFYTTNEDFSDRLSDLNEWRPWVIRLLTFAAWREDIQKGGNAYLRAVSVLRDLCSGSLPTELAD